MQESRALSEKERMRLDRLLAHGTPESNSHAHHPPLPRIGSRCGRGCPTTGLVVGNRTASPPARLSSSPKVGGVSPEGILSVSSFTGEKV